MWLLCLFVPDVLTPLSLWISSHNAGRDQPDQTQAAGQQADPGEAEEAATQPAYREVTVALSNVTLEGLL